MAAIFSAFYESDLGNYLSQHARLVQSNVAALSPDAILSGDVDQIAATLAQELALMPPRIDFDDPRVRSSQQLVDAGPSRLPGIFPDRSGKVDRHVVTYRLPFTGDPQLLRFRPSSYPLHSVQVYVDGDRLCFDVVDDQNSAEAVKQAAQQNIATMRTLAATLLTDIERYNGGLQAVIAQAIRARRQQMERRKSMMGELGLPQE